MDTILNIFSSMKDIFINKPMTDEALHFALLDLAEYGFIVIDSIEDKKYIEKNCSVDITIEQIGNTRFIIRTV